MRWSFTGELTNGITLNFVTASSLPTMDPNPASTSGFEAFASLVVAAQVLLDRIWLEKRASYMEFQAVLRWAANLI